MAAKGSVRCDRCRSRLPAEVPDAIVELRVQTLCTWCAMGGAPKRPTPAS